MKRERGAVLVETALILPLYVVFLAFAIWFLSSASFRPYLRQKIETNIVYFLEREESFYIDGYRDPELWLRDEIKASPWRVVLEDFQLNLKLGNCSPEGLCALECTVRWRLLGFSTQIGVGVEFYNSRLAERPLLPEER